MLITDTLNINVSSSYELMLSYKAHITPSLSFTTNPREEQRHTETNRIVKKKKKKKKTQPHLVLKCVKVCLNPFVGRYPIIHSSLS